MDHVVPSIYLTLNTKKKEFKYLICLIQLPIHSNINDIHSNINDIIDFYRACVGSSIIIENKYSHIVFLYVFFIYFDMQF